MSNDAAKIGHLTSDEPLKLKADLWRRAELSVDDQGNALKHPPTVRVNCSEYSSFSLEISFVDTRQSGMYGKYIVWTEIRSSPARVIVVS